MTRETDSTLPYRRILFVETDFVHVRQATRALQPHPVVSVPSLLQAQEFLDRYQFDVVVFDPDRWGPPGLDFLLELTRDLPRVRRIIYSRNQAAQHAFGLAHATVLKPADLEVLREAVLGRGDQREYRPLRDNS
jgi:DNA-binding NarL/FixJ family response regulator